MPDGENMIYIIRHGQTAKNKAKTLQGRSDEPLNDMGIVQAEKVGDWFREKKINFDIVYSSPLSRAIDTAKILVPELSPIIDRRLIEMDYGPYEGMDLSNPLPEIVTFFSDFVHNPAPAGMEQLKEVVSRTGSFIDSIIEEAKEKQILISTHAIAMKGILEYLTPESKGRYWSKYIGNCAVYKTEYRDGGYTVPEEVMIT